MAFNVPFPNDHDDLRSAVRALCADFQSEYWRKVDEARAYPEDFVNALTFPIAQAYAEIEAASLMRLKAAWLHDHGKACGAEANLAKLLSADASWKAANACLQTHGGFGFAAEYDVERKFRETRL